MIAIGRGQLHAPDCTITDEPNRVEQGRLSRAIGPNRTFTGSRGSETSASER